MLSKIDIERQIGKGINIVPFKRDNIKENSINFTISNMAWTLNPKDTGQGYNNANPACSSGILTLEPHSTTVVYTEEVIALNNKLGGTFHVKVGIVSKGVVFSSTMIGPSYCGHLMVSIQNPTDKKIKLSVGETFISLVLNKLDTKIRKEHTNSNNGGHTSKLGELGIENASRETKILDEDWKKNIETIQSKLKLEADYISLRAEISKKSRTYFLAIIVFFLIISLIILGIVTVLLKTTVLGEDTKTTISTIIIGGIGEIVTIIISIFSGIIKKILKIDI